MPFAAGQRVLASQLNIPNSIPVAPATNGASGTATSGTTDTRDDVLGVYQWTAVAGVRYRAVIDDLLGSCGVANDLYTLRIRWRSDGTTPTTSDTAVAQSAWLCVVAGGPGQYGASFGGTFLATTSGTNTIAFFAQRSAGTGSFTPVSVAGGRQLYVVTAGTV